MRSMIAGGVMMAALVATSASAAETLIDTVANGCKQALTDVGVK